MTLQDLYNALTDAGFDVHYGVAPVGTPCPYVVLADVAHPNILADDKTYAKTTECTLTLVEAEAHDFDLAQDLEDKLDDLNIPYTVDEAWAPAEGVVETYYSIAFYGGIPSENVES